MSVALVGIASKWSRRLKYQNTVHCASQSERTLIKNFA